jgi:hypothetical protein
MIQADREVVAPQQESDRTGVAPRNDQFLEWYEAKGADTFRSHATIRDKWNALTLAERQTICPNRPQKLQEGKKGRQVVIKGVQRAKICRSRNVPKSDEKSGEKLRALLKF